MQAEELQFNDQDPKCTLTFFNGKDWKDADRTILSGKTTQVVVPPSKGKTASLSLIDGKWYASTASCFIKATNRGPASDGSSQVFLYEGIPEAPQRALEFYSGFGLIGHSYSLVPKYAGPKGYNLSSHVSQFEFGAEKNFSKGQKWSVALGGMFGVGFASLRAGDHTDFSYEMAGQVTYSERLEAVANYFFSDSFKIGIAAGPMFTYFKFPALVSNDYNAPTSIQWSMFWQATAQMRLSKSFGVRLGAGCNQLSSRFMGNLGFIIQL